MLLARDLDRRCNKSPVGGSRFWTVSCPAAKWAITFVTRQKRGWKPPLELVPCKKWRCQCRSFLTLLETRCFSNYQLASKKFNFSVTSCRKYEMLFRWTTKLENLKSIHLYKYFRTFVDFCIFIPCSMCCPILKCGSSPFTPFFSGQRARTRSDPVYDVVSAVSHYNFFLSTKISIKIWCNYLF